MKRILDPSFRYRPSFETDIRKTFAEIRRQLAAQENAPPHPAVSYLATSRARKDPHR